MHIKLGVNNTNAEDYKPTLQTSESESQRRAPTPTKKKKTPFQLQIITHLLVQPAPSGNIRRNRDPRGEHTPKKVSCTTQRLIDFTRQPLNVSPLDLTTFHRPTGGKHEKDP